MAESHEGTKPVNKKLAAALSGGAVLILALTGCTSEEGNKELDAWADSKAFQDLADGYKARAALIRDAGAPPGVEGGAKNQQDVVKKLTDLSAAYADLKKQVDGLNTKDQGKFASGLKDVSAEMKQVETQRQNAIASLKKLESGDVKTALTSQDGCKQAVESGSAG